MIPPRLIRRLLAPLLLGLAVIVFLGFSVIAGVVGLVTLVADRRARLLRLAAMSAVYAAIEVAVVIAMLVTWGLRLVRLAGDGADRRVTGWALATVLGAARIINGFRVELQEPDSWAPLDRPDPVLVLARHGGIGDSFALVHLLIARYRRRPRVVLKGVLRWDPMLDVALTRMGACWLEPSSGEAGRDAIGRLAADARPGDAVLLFPEGGNWTARRRYSGMARLWRTGQGDALKTAALLEHVLPPKPGGVLACLDAQPDMPVVIIAHTGLDKITSLQQLWAALPFRVPMKMRWWPAAPAPLDESGRLRWLTTEWAVVDQWIDASPPPSE